MLRGVLPASYAGLSIISLRCQISDKLMVRQCVLVWPPIHPAGPDVVGRQLVRGVIADTPERSVSQGE